MGAMVRKLSPQTGEKHKLDPLTCSPSDEVRRTSVMCCQPDGLRVTPRHELLPVITRELQVRPASPPHIGCAGSARRWSSASDAADGGRGQCFTAATREGDLHRHHALSVWGS